ncbi:MAG: hypothetical protein K1060chlam5_00702 [Candidatus Anoxychlamydiales bacterium]|nr:hypothetical protein [Candidatus Anoxychlamydiales bacterium]
MSVAGLQTLAGLALVRENPKIELHKGCREYKQLPPEQKERIDKIQNLSNILSLPREDLDLAANLSRLPHPCISLLSTIKLIDDDYLTNRSISLAAKEGDIDLIKYYLFTKYPNKTPNLLNKADENGKTPLAWAAKKGHRAIVRLLIDRGATIDQADDLGSTPLVWATWSGDKATVRLLLDRGAAIDFVDNIGFTPLVWAAWSGDEEVVRLLLDRGAAIDHAENFGSTPLAWAKRNGHEATARLLLERGAR